MSCGVRAGNKVIREQRLLETTNSAHREEGQICRGREGPFTEEGGEGERRKRERK